MASYLIFDEATSDSRATSRAIASLSNGTLIAVRLDIPFVADADDYDYEFYYSDDHGQTWTQCGGSSTIAGVTDDNMSIAVDNDRIFVGYSTESGSDLRIRSGVFSAGSITWDTGHTDNTFNSGAVDIDVVTIGTTQYVAYAAESGTTYAESGVLSRTSGGTWSVEHDFGLLTRNANSTQVRVQFKKDLDGTPVASPDILILVADTSPAIYSWLHTYSSGPTWTEDTTGSSVGSFNDHGLNAPMGLAWDGTRFLAALMRSTTPYTVLMESTDGSTWTERTGNPAFYDNGTGAFGVDVGVDANGDAFLFSASPTDKELAYAKYDRGGSSWDASLTVLDSLRGYNFVRSTSDQNGIHLLLVDHSGGSYTGNGYYVDDFLLVAAGGTGWGIVLS